MCILKSDMNASVTTTNAWNSKVDTEGLGEALYRGFSIRGVRRTLDVYFRSLWGKRFPEFFTPKGTILDKELSLLPLSLSVSRTNASGLIVCKNVQIGLTVGQHIQC